MAFTSARNAVAGLLTTWLNREFVKDVEWILQDQKFTTKAIIPPGSGKIGRFNVFAEPPSVNSYSTTSTTTALTETFTTQNEINTITAASPDITIAEYGEFHKTSALAMYSAVPGAREKLLKRLVDGANVTIDELVRLKAIQTTKYIYCTAAATGGTTTFSSGSVTAMNCAALMQAHKILFAAKAKGFSGVSGHPDGHFAAILSPQAELDVMTEDTTGRVYWSNLVVNVAGRLGQEKVVNGYIGSVYGVAVYVTQNFGTAITYTASSTGDIQMVLADGAVGAMAFKDMEPEVVINDVNSPYKNVDSIAWHIFFGCGLVDGNRAVEDLQRNLVIPGGGRYQLPPPAGLGRCVLQDFGQTLDETTVKNGLRRLNPDFHFDLGTNIGQHHPYQQTRQSLFQGFPYLLVEAPQALAARGGERLQVLVLRHVAGQHEGVAQLLRQLRTFSSSLSPW